VGVGTPGPARPTGAHDGPPLNAATPWRLPVGVATEGPARPAGCQTAPSQLNAATPCSVPVGVGTLMVGSETATDYDLRITQLRITYYATVTVLLIGATVEPRAFVAVTTQARP
jgi:hypothetical protein